MANKRHTVLKSTTNSKKEFLIILLLLFLALSTGCFANDPATSVNIRIRNLSDFEIAEVNLGHGRQNGADYFTRYGDDFNSEGYTDYKNIRPNVANYGSVEIRSVGFSSLRNYWTGHIDSLPANPATRDPLEAGKYYTFEFDFEPNEKRPEVYLDVIYFNIVEDPPPTE